VAAGQAWARDLVNEPAAAIYPQSLAEQAETLRASGLEVTVWDEKKLVDEGMGGITAVGQGSAQPPRFIHVAWKPANPSRKVALVGKGVTFDAGGLSIKPTSGMLTMKCDMGGSASVLGVMRAIADLKPDVEVHGLIGAAENMLGGNAFKLGDVVTMRNGKTVEIHNTDAEGRLCLADCLSYGSELGVDQMVDIATLTGAAVVALGEHYSALMTRSESFAASLLGHADASGEGLWRLPLPAFYKEKLNSQIATVKNVGGRAAGSITAGLFLNEFVTDTEWAHIDIAGPAFLDKGRRHFGHGGTGAMVPTLTRWVLEG
jgi:leucyl aminopeptidase